MEELALHGGQPVRTEPYPKTYPGAVVYGSEEADLVQEILEAQSPYRYYGPNLLYKTREFEQAFSKKFGFEHTLGVSSGTAALVVALKAAGIGPGDKVIIPACTFIATAGAVVVAGAVPVFCDIDDSLNIDPDAIESCVDQYTKALITVPILGNPCEMDRIMAIAKKHDLIVIEDVAQSCGSRYQGNYMGSYGHINCFSLQVNKIITSGEGGAVVTSDPLLYERAVRYHDQGMFREREGFMNIDEQADIFIGQNYRMSEIAGALGLAQLEKIDTIIARMHHIKYKIKNAIRDIEGIEFRNILDEEGDASNALILLLPDSDAAQQFAKALSAEGIPAGRLYNGEPIYMTPQIFQQRTADRDNFPFNQFPEKVEYTRDMCPNALEIMPRNVMISLSPNFTEDDADDVIAAIRKVAAAQLTLRTSY